MATRYKRSGVRPLEPAAKATSQPQSTRCATQPTRHFSPRRAQSPALAISVVDTKEVEDVRHSVRVVARPPRRPHQTPSTCLARGQRHITGTYPAVVQLFGVIAGDNLALQVLCAMTKRNYIEAVAEPYISFNKE